MDNSDDLYDWLSGPDDSDPSASQTTVPVIGSQPASTVAPTNSTSWFDSLIHSTGTLGTAAAGVYSSLTGKTVLGGTAKNPTATAVSPMMSYIPLAIAAAAIIGIGFLMFRRKR
jgi:hypothetical protein